MDNVIIGYMVRCLGDQVRIDGMRFSLDNPLISCRHKSTVFFGIYEQAERKLVKRYIRSCDEIIELGGSIGVVSCIANRMLEDANQHLVIEANPLLLPILERNRALNSCGFAVLNAALAYGTREIAFDTENHFLMGHVSSSLHDGRLRVPTCTLDDLTKNRKSSNMVLLCDIEGAEIDMIRNELDVLRSRFRLIIMETHPTSVGPEKNASAISTLSNAGFKIVQQESDVIAFLRESQ
jgi:FkbM family methyltransferase